MISLIREKLKGYTGKAIDCEQDICAGVLVPVFEKEGETFIVLTRRTDTVKMHKGEVSFPGGMCEDEDASTLDTALRECCEEIGVRKTDVEVVGRLDDMVTVTGFVVTPYVGIMPYPYTFKTNPKEVAYIIYLPVEYLMAVDTSTEQAEYKGRNTKVHSFYYNGDRIWGATCRMLLQFRNILKDEKI
jgi:8-oxo-dGTP pyrophosphatase MutT (NUDIX family)